MPRGAYTAKQDRKADHIEKSYEKRGVGKKEAEERAWRTVNKQDKGGKNEGSGRSSSRSAGGEKGLGNPPPQRQRLSVQKPRSRISIARSTARSSLWASRPSLLSQRMPRRRAAMPVGRGRPRVSRSASRRRLFGSACASTRPARTSASTDRLTAGAPRPTAAAISLSVAGSCSRDRAKQLAPRPIGPLGRAVGDTIVRNRRETRRKRAR